MLLHLAMPYLGIDIDEGKGKLRKGIGVMTGKDLLDFASKQNADRGPDWFQKMDYLLADLSEVTDFQIAPEEMRQFAEFNVEVAKAAVNRLALVVAPDPYVFGMARFWQGLTSRFDWKIHVDRSKEKALEWARTVWSPESGKALDDYPDMVNYLEERLFYDAKEGLLVRRELGQ